MVELVLSRGGKVGVPVSGRGSGVGTGDSSGKPDVAGKLVSNPAGFAGRPGRVSDAVPEVTGVTEEGSMGGNEGTGSIVVSTSGRVVCPPGIEVSVVMPNSVLGELIRTGTGVTGIERSIWVPSDRQVTS
jgi:hypothetical protein